MCAFCSSRRLGAETLVAEVHERARIADPPCLQIWERNFFVCARHTPDPDGIYVVDTLHIVLIATHCKQANVANANIPQQNLFMIKILQKS